MLAHFLAIAVALGSSLFYLAAFFFPEIHRQRDFLWCGVGWFYALVLWVCAGRITGGVLLGQTASVALLGWLTWQTLSLRRVKTPIAEQTEMSEAAIATATSGLGLGKWMDRIRPPAPTESTPAESTPTEASEAIAPLPEESEPVEASEAIAPPPEASESVEASEAIAPPPEAFESVEASEAIAPEPPPTPTTPLEPVRAVEVMATEPALLNEDCSDIPEPDVLKDLESLGLIDDEDYEPFHITESAAPQPAAPVEPDAPEANPEPEVIVIKGEVVKDTDPDAWV